MVALAPKGAQPGGVVAETTRVTGIGQRLSITANRTATLQFEDGSSAAFPVRDDIDLSQPQGWRKGGVPADRDDCH
jgi:hypothetical protein